MSLLRSSYSCLFAASLSVLYAYVWDVDMKSRPLFHGELHGWRDVGVPQVRCEDIMTGSENEPIHLVRGHRCSRHHMSWEDSHMASSPCALLCDLSPERYYRSGCVPRTIGAGDRLTAIDPTGHNSCTVRR